MKTSKLIHRSRETKLLRAQWLQAIREYVRCNNLSPVFRFRPGQLILGTRRSGGTVTLEGTLTGNPTPIYIVAWPEIRASVIQSGDKFTVKLMQSRPGVACSPLEQLFRVSLSESMVTTPIVMTENRDSFLFAVEVRYQPFVHGFEHLSEAHLELLYRDVVATRVDR